MKRFCRLFVFLIVLSCWIPSLAAAQVVNMPDRNLAAMVRTKLGLAPDAPITRQALQSLTHLTDYQQGLKREFPIKDLTGLEHATRLKIVFLLYHDISDLGPLEGLPILQSLYISRNPINDFSPLAGLTQLRILDVSVRSVALMNNLRRHVDLTQLEGLEIDGGRNRIGDLRLFANLTQLKSFGFSSAQIRDVTPLASLTQLKSLALSNNEIRDVTPLAGLTQLERLHLYNNEIRDVTPLAGLTQLETLFLSNNQIDITSLASLTQLDNLALSNNEIRDVTPLAGLTQLTILWLSDNEIRDVTPLAGLTQLKLLFLQHNQIRDVTPIQHLIDSASTLVLLEGNPIGEQPEGEADLVVETVKATRFISTAEMLRSSVPANEKRYADPDEKFTLHATVRNQGTETSAKTRLMFYRSTDNRITPGTNGDKAVGAVEIGPLSPQDTATFTLYDVAAPETAGIHYYGACVVDVKGNGTGCSPNPAKLTVTRPDLKITSIKAGQKGDPLNTIEETSLTAAPGAEFDLLVRIKNEGKRVAQKTVVTFYRSKDAQISEDDQELKTTTNNRLPPNTTDTHIVTFQLPEAGGTYYYGAKVAPVKYESDTDNNWSVGVRVGAEDLEVPSNLISDVAVTQNVTYFIVNAQFPKLLIENQNGIIYGSCVIRFDIPRVPDVPLQQWDSKHRWLAGNPPYFMYPLLSPRQRIDAVNAKYALDATEVVIGGIAAATGLAVAHKVLPLIPLAPIASQTDKLAKVVLSVGSKFKVYIPPQKVEKGLAKAGRWVISRVIGASPNYLTAMSLKTVTQVIGGNEKEPTIQDQLLAFTGDPILTLLPISSSGTPPPPSDESRYLFRIPQAVADIGITIEQVYFFNGEASTAVYKGTWNLGKASGAPRLHPMSVVAYPPFQHLPPEIQEYLLRDFGEFTSAETRQVPETTTLLPNYPNPFNPETWIPYQLAKPSDVSLTIYDINGRVVRTLDLGHRRAGVYRSRGRTAYWDGKNEFGEPVASGLYFYTLTAGDFSATRRMLIRK